MRKPLEVLAALLLSCSPVLAAVKTFDVRAPSMRQRTEFRLEVVGDRSGLKTETVRNGRPFVNAEKGESYSVRLHNPLPVRVAVNLTVDGLNSITGKPAGIVDGEKWMIEPYGTLELRGWQVNGDETRRFFFTDKPKSYAKWRGDSLGRDLAANCGVIGAAYFWNQGELNRYYEEQRRRAEEYSRESYPVAPAAMRGASSGLNSAAKSAPAALDAAAAAGAAERYQAGTGMGDRESHPTTQVEFRFDAGMYRPSQALLVYYDFAPEPPAPDAFPQASYAPEMP